MIENFNLGDIVLMKKPHPCGANEWEIIRVGADIKIQCLSCKRIIMLPRNKFIKNCKKILKEKNKGKEL